MSISFHSLSCLPPISSMAVRWKEQVHTPQEYLSPAARRPSAIFASSACLLIAACAIPVTQGQDLTKWRAVKNGCRYVFSCSKIWLFPPSGPCARIAHSLLFFPPCSKRRNPNPNIQVWSYSDSSHYPTHAWLLVFRWIKSNKSMPAIEKQSTPSPSLSLSLGP